MTARGKPGGHFHTRFKSPSINRRLLLYFAFQTTFSLGVLFYGHSRTESQIRVLGKLTQDVLEHSVHIGEAFFKIQALPVGQILELVQGSIVMYSDPEALQKGVQKVITKRAEIDESLESLRASIHSEILTEAIQATIESSNRFNDAIDKSASLLLNGQKTEGDDVLMNRCTLLGAGLEQASGTYRAPARTSSPTKSMRYVD